jgi:DNA repair photolyase
MNSIKSLEKAININEDIGLRNYYIKNRYPISISNTGDSFSTRDPLIWEKLRILKQAGFPLYIETKGPHSEADTAKMFDIIDSKDIVYITVSNITRRDFEPYAPNFEQRKQFIKECQSRGIMVEVGLNPYIPSQSSSDDTINMIRELGNSDIVYTLWPLHGVKNIHPNASKVNPEARKPQLWSDVSNILQVFDELSIPYDGRYANQFFWGKQSASEAMKSRFNKPIMISDSIVKLCRQGYEEDKQDESEYVIGGISWDDFVKNTDIPDITVKRGEIRVRPKYAFLEKKIPECISMKEYLKLGFYNPLGINSLFNFSGLWYDGKEAYFWPMQRRLKEYLKWR